MKTQLLPYMQLAQSFVDSKFSATEFEAKYLKLFQYDKTDLTEAEYIILNNLFWAVEDFCSYSELRDEGDLDEIQLLQAAEVALAALKQLETDQTMTVSASPPVVKKQVVEISVDQLEGLLSDIVGKQLETQLPKILEEVLKKLEKPTSFSFKTN